MKTILILLCLVTHINGFAQNVGLDRKPILLNAVNSNQLSVAINYPGMASRVAECVFLRAPETTGFSTKRVA